MRKYYYISDDPGGDGGGENPPTAPKGYAVTTPQQRSDWNGFLDYAGKQPGANLNDPKRQVALLAGYKKANPNFSITADQIPNIQYEAYQIRKGDKFGNLGAKELGYIRQGLSPNYINADTANVGKLYYPQMSSHGTDLEGYYNSKFGSAPSPSSVASSAVAAPAGNPQNAKSLAAPAPVAPATGNIPLPDYQNPASRLNYAKQFREKYGKKTLENLGDIPLRVNETPSFGTDSSKNLARKAAAATGVDPALLYASAMLEGQSSLYPGSVKGVKKDEVEYTGDDEFPVSGLWNYGLDSFQDYLPTLKQKGYLPKDFDKSYKIFDKPGGPNGKDGREESVMFKTADAGLQAKAAMMRAFNDELDNYAKTKNINLTGEQRDFFRLAHFNSGEHGYQLLDAYNKMGLLKDNKFLKSIPEIDVPAFVSFYKGDKAKAAKLHKQIYTNVVPRLDAARGLKEEKLFE